MCLTLLLAGMLLSAAGFWARSNARKDASDEAKYQQWQHSYYSYQRLAFAEGHLPSSFCKALRLPALRQRYCDKEEQIGKALVASGYLTNVHITATNAGARFTQIADQIRKAAQGSGAKWELSGRSNAVVVLTCRQQDVPVCTRGLDSQ